VCACLKLKEPDLKEPDVGGAKVELFGCNMSHKQTDAKEARRALITRIRNSTKPVFFEGRPVFYQCALCGELLIKARQRSEQLRVQCCGKDVLPLVENGDALLSQEHVIDIEFVGGFEANAAVVTIGEPAHAMTKEHRIEWMYVYSFRGGQLKYFRQGQEPRAVFAFAEEDTYVYCDREVCKLCKFNCKRGFTVYAYCSQHGLWSFVR